MTSQEKAIELIDQYRLILIQSETDAGEEILCTTIAKQCALMAVDELYRIAPWSLENDIQDDSKQYWNLVKIEIEKL